MTVWPSTLRDRHRVVRLSTGRLLALSTARRWMRCSLTLRRKRKQLQVLPSSKSSILSRFGSWNSVPLGSEFRRTSFVTINRPRRVIRVISSLTLAIAAATAKPKLKQTMTMTTSSIHQSSFQPPVEIPSANHSR